MQQRELHAPACEQVEATKFTEVGFHGRDVDQIVRDLVDAAIVSTRAKLKRQLRADISAAVEAKILDSLLGADGPATTRVRALWGGGCPQAGVCVHEERGKSIFPCPGSSSDAILRGGQSLMDIAAVLDGGLITRCPL